MKNSRFTAGLMALGFTLVLGITSPMNARADVMPQDYWYFVQSFGTSGSGTGQFSEPRGIAIGPDSNVYVADSSNRIEVFQQNGQFVRQWTASNPFSLAFGPDGNLYVGAYSISGSTAIRVYSTVGSLVRQWGTSGTSNGQFGTGPGTPFENGAAVAGIAVGSDGTVFALDGGNHRVQAFSSNGSFVTKFGISGSAPGQFGNVRGLALSPDGKIYTSEDQRVQVFEQNGQFIRQFSRTDALPPGQYATSLAIGADGIVYAGYAASWSWCQPFLIYSADGTLLKNFSSDTSGKFQFSGESIEIAFSPSGKVFASNPGKKCIQVYGQSYRSISSGSLPLPGIVNVQQRAASTYLDIDYKVVDSDSPTVEVYPLGFLNGTKDLSHVIPMTTFVEGTDANKGAGVTSGTTHRLSWNAPADWSASYGELKVEILANDGRALLPLEFVTLPASGLNPQLKISRSPYGDSDFLSIWFWLLAKRDSAISLVNGQVVGVGGSYAGQVLASGTSTTASGRDFLFGRLNVRAASAAEVTRAMNGPNANFINQWTPQFTVGPGDFPRAVNEYGFDTGSYSSDYYWVVPTN